MAKIQRLARQALKTFRVKSGSPVKENLDLLKAMVRRTYFIAYIIKRITFLPE